MPLLAQEEALAAAVGPEDEAGAARGRAVDAELVLDVEQAMSLNAPIDPSVHRNLGTTKRLRPLGPVGVGGPGEHGVYDAGRVRSWSPAVMKIFRR